MDRLSEFSFQEESQIVSNFLHSSSHSFTAIVPCIAYRWRVIGSDLPGDSEQSDGLRSLWQNQGRHDIGELTSTPGG